VRTSPIAFRDAVHERILALVWRQWSAIGVPGYSDAEETGVVDPEALLLLTMTVGRWDMRLFDEALRWLRANGVLLNVQRLKNLARGSGDTAKATLAAVAELLTADSAMAPKWRGLASRWVLQAECPLFLLRDGRPLPRPEATDEVFRRHGLLRAPVESGGGERPFATRGPASLLLRLRALLGVSLRCEILCVLGSTDEVHPSRVARSLGLAPRSIQKALAEMVLSGAIQVRTEARRKSYSLAPGILDALLRPQGPTPWRSSAPLFRACEVLWAAVSDPQLETREPMLLASQWRRVMRAIAPDLAEAGMLAGVRSDRSYPGAQYADVFVEDVDRILAAAL
jgi:hypothetical protein